MTTKQEVESSPIFKIIKKGLILKYPWIKDVFIENEDDLKQYTTLLFLTLNIDLPKLAKLTDSTPEWWLTQKNVMSFLGRPYYEAVYLTTFFDKKDSSKISEIEKDIASEIKRIQKSNVIPSEYRYNKKTFNVSAYRWNFPQNQNDKVTSPTDGADPRDTTVNKPIENAEQTPKSS